MRLLSSHRFESAHCDNCEENFRFSKAVEKRNIFNLTLLSPGLCLKLDFPLMITLSLAKSTSQGEGGPMVHESSGSVDVSRGASPRRTNPDSPGY